MERDSRVNRYSLLLIPLGIAVNVIGVRLALYLELPLFLDSIGTVLAAALGGYLPGIIVGFLSNVINGISDPITLYYGILSVLIAAAASVFSRRGFFRSFGKSLLAALVFALIGGGLGSVLTWLLYGFSFGTGISAPFAAVLHQNAGLTEFWAQFSADMAIDVFDKLITVCIVFIVLRLLPAKLMHKTHLGRLYKCEPAAAADVRRFYRRMSLRSKIVLLIVATTTLLGTLATLISFMLYREAVTKKHIETASGVATLMLTQIDADRIDGYLESGVEDETYRMAEANLADIRDSIPQIEYMYVYQIRPDGCHVVFDIDTPTLPGESLCSIVPIEEEFLPRKADLLAGREIEPIISTGRYGWLLTVYKPMYDSDGKCVAYAAADVNMDDVVTDRYVFIIKMISLLFGTSMLIITAAVWYVERRLVAPINAMTEAADKFAYESEAERLITTARLGSIQIGTGDEIESLFRSLTKTALDVANYIDSIHEKSEIITQMQNNIIISFASMVESRDRNTGEHIRHTANYVELIAQRLRSQARYADELTEAYIDGLVRSAPLHDIGKIEISDAILNKPGILTSEEFDKMKTHTTAGRAILEGIVQHIADADYLSAALDMAAYHHERWDGRGYPEGRAGEDIPLCARIMAVADVFDALISRRSYKEAMPFERAVEIIRAESGTHFDPAVVEAFLSDLDEVRKLT